MTYHQTIIVANLGADPELRYTQQGKAVCNFSAAVSERWTSNDQPQERTTWYRVSVWGNQAESCNKYLHKGSQVMVIGNVSANAYTTNTGEPAASLDLNARTVRFLSGNGNGAGQAERDPNDVPF